MASHFYGPMSDESCECAQVIEGQELKNACYQKREGSAVSWVTSHREQEKSLGSDWVTEEMGHGASVTTGSPQPLFVLLYPVT